jgi:tetratricopeptide (TPR) repeat protein
MRHRQIIVVLLLVGILLPGSIGYPQSRPRKPVLIRDTGVAEGKEGAEKEKMFNPMEAEKSVIVGNFYLKKKNYAAAIERYLEALEYQPNLIDAYEALARAYEKSGEIEKALAVCNDFISKYPYSPKVKKFRSQLTKLKKKQQKKQSSVVSGQWIE